MDDLCDCLWRIECMTKNFNIFARRIGIYYKDREWGERVFMDIKETLPEDVIAKVYTSIRDMSLLLKDGSFVKVVPVNESSRGWKWDLCYMQEGIDMDTYQVIILRSLISTPFGNDAIVIKNADDIFHKWGEPARKWFI